MEIDSDNGKALQIFCDFRENDFLRDMPSKRFNARKRCWVGPCLARNVKFLRATCPNAKWTDRAKVAADAVMNSIDIPANEPIPMGFKFKTEPLEKQLECLQLFHNRKESAWFMGTGTGKSKTLIDKTAIHYYRNEIDAAVYFCPATVKLPWVLDQMQKHCSADYEAYIHDGDSKKFEEFMLRPRGKLKFMMVSSEALSVGNPQKLVALLKRFMLAHRCLVGVDETHDFKNHKSMRTENLHQLKFLPVVKVVMTGTPIDEGMMDLFSYFEFLNPNILGFGDFYSFRSRYAIMGGFEDKQVVSYQNVDELMAAIKPFVFQCTKEEMADLPPKTYQRRLVKMTAKQTALYKELCRDKTISYEDIQHDVENVLEQMMLKQYIASGFFSYNKIVRDMLNDEGEELLEREVQVIEEYPPKVKDAMAYIESLPRDASVIIWSRWTREMDVMIEQLQKKYGADQVVQIRGGISSKNKDAARVRFEAKEARFCVAHPASGGVGLTLIAATYEIYLSNTFRLINRVQSEDRAHRIGQDKNVTICDIMCVGTVDEDVLAAIEAKMNVAQWVQQTLKDQK